MRRKIEDLGECEDARPCDLCGEDYVFLIDDDPGHCSACRRVLAANRDYQRSINRARRRLTEVN